MSNERDERRRIMASNTSSTQKQAHSWALLGGDLSLSPSALAKFRIGDNSATSNGQYEYLLASVEGGIEQEVKHGHLTWDPACTEKSAPFLGIAQVCLEYTPRSIKWSVGTNDFLFCEGKRPQTLHKIEIAASVLLESGSAFVRWDQIDLTLYRRDGSVECVASPCLPFVSNMDQMRRSKSAPNRKTSGRQQYAQFCTDDPNLEKVQLRGLIRLAADGELDRPLGPEDLAGQIAIYAGPT